MKEKIDTTKQLVNEDIRVPRLQVITSEGENLGVISRDEALRAARGADLDLVLVADQGALGVPIAKIMNFGKALYVKKKKQAEAKKHQKIIQIKEVKMRPNIGEHDFQTKIKQASQFLKDGKHLKVTLVFKKGREMSLSSEQGPLMFEKISQALHEQGVKNLAEEKDSRMGSFWSKIYYPKPAK